MTLVYKHLSFINFIVNKSANSVTFDDHGEQRRTEKIRCFKIGLGAVLLKLGKYRAPIKLHLLSLLKIDTWHNLIFTIR